MVIDIACKTIMNYRLFLFFPTLFEIPFEYIYLTQVSLCQLETVYHETTYTLLHVKLSNLCLLLWAMFLFHKVIFLMNCRSRNSKMYLLLDVWWFKVKLKTGLSRSLVIKEAAIPLSSVNLKNIALNDLSVVNKVSRNNFLL